MMQALQFTYLSCSFSFLLDTTAIIAAPGPLLCTCQKSSMQQLASPNLLNNSTTKDTNVLGNDEFRRIWFKLQGEPSTEKRKGMLGSILVDKVFAVSQFISVLKLFQLASDKTEVLEMSTMRLVNISQKHEIIAQFPESLRGYIEHIVNESVLSEPLKNSRLGVFVLRSLNEKTKDDVEHIIRALSKSAFSSNQKQVITALMRKSVFPLTHKQAYQIVSKFLNNGTALTSVLEIINPFVLGFTCREACLILQYIKDEKIRLNALRLLSCTITDPQNRWMLFDSAFEDTRMGVQNKSKEIILDISSLPRSHLFGTITSQNVVFVLCAGATMKTTFESSQRERLSRLRCAVREMCAALKAQCSVIEDGRFNIIVQSGGESHVWKSEGLVTNSPANLNDACCWLRSIRPAGRGLEVSDAFQQCFSPKLHSAIDDVYFLTDYGFTDYPQAVQNIVGYKEKFEDAQKANVTIHATLLNAGKHHWDNIFLARKFCIELSERSGGMCRAMVGDDFVQHMKQVNSNSSWKRISISPKRELVYRLMVFFSYVVMLVVVVLARLTPPLGYQRCEDVAFKFPTFLTPSKTIFRGASHMTLFLNSLIVFILTLPHTKTRLDPGVLAIMGPKISFYHCLVALWMWLQNHDELLAAVITMAAMLGTLVVSYVQLGVGVRPRNLLNWAEVVFIHVPTGALLAWISFLFTLSLAIYFTWWEWYGFGMQAEWAIIMMSFLFFLSVFMLKKRSDPIFGCMICYCFTGIAKIHWNSARSLGDVYNAPRLNESYIIMVVATSMVALLAALCTEIVWKRVQLTFYNTTDREHVRSIVAIAKQQSTNFCAWLCMCLVNVACSPNGAELLGFAARRAPINMRTCGEVARMIDAPLGNIGKYRGTIRVMPHKWVFRFFYVIYAWMGLYVFSHLIPFEIFSSNGTTLRSEDKDLNRFVFLRGPSTDFFVCGNRKCPAVHRWRFTLVAYERFVRSVGMSFAVTCYLNIAFMLCFLHRSSIAAFVVLILLLGSILSLYKKVGVFPAPVSEKNEAEKKIIKTQFDEAHSKVEESIKKIKWESIEEKINLKNKRVSWVEVFCLHVPISLYLGLISFCMLLMTAYFLLMNIEVGPTQWDLGGYTSEGFAWSMLLLVAVVILYGGLKRKDPCLPIGYAIPLVGIFLENTWNTCLWNTSSGIAVRKPNSALVSQRARTKELAYHAGGESGGNLMWFWNLTDSEGVVVDENYRNSDCNVDCQCKSAVESGGSNENGKAWAFGPRGRQLTYYDQNTNPNGDYKFVGGRCRRIYKDKNDDPLTDSTACSNLGNYDLDITKDIVKGYRWMENVCVEDPGVCPYQYASSPMHNHTPEYVAATSSLSIAGILLIFSLLFLRTRFKLWKKRRRNQVAWKDMFRPSRL
jgi:hypothetical protein